MYNKKLIGVIIVFALLVGCSDQTSKEEKDIVKIKQGSLETYEDKLLAEDIEEDVDNDGEMERIKLIISPAPIKDPEHENQYLWSDSHVWQLIVEDNGVTYPLYEEHVQGLAEMFIVSEEGQKVIVFQTKGTTLSLMEFRYNDKGYFEREDYYNKGPIIYRSLIK